MSIVERALNRLGLSTTRQLEEAIKRELEKVPMWLGETADAQQWDIPDPHIFANQSDLYRVSSILGTAMDILADDVGLTNFNVKRMVGEEEREIKNHEYEVLLRSPNPLDSGVEFMRDTTMSYKLNGNAVWWLNRTDKNDKPLEIWPIPYQMVEPVPDKRLYLSHYNYHPGMGKEAIPLPTWQIVHFKTYNPRSRFWGLSPLESLIDTIQGNLGMRQTKNKQYTKYGGMPPYILAFRDWVPNESWNDIKKEKARAAMENEVMMLRGVGDGVSLLERAMSSKDADFVENLKSDMEDVFNRIAPGLLAMLDKNSTEANALAARATYAEKSLWKTLETFAQKQTAEILPVYGRKLKGEYDDPRVVDRRLELEEMAEYGKTHTVEETRAKFHNDEPLGDERDNMLVTEIRVKASSSFENQTEQPEYDEQSENISGEETETDDTSLKAAEDLGRWRTMALRGKVKAAKFESEFIPAVMLSGIKRRLRVIDNKDDIAALFDDAIKRMKPVPRVSGAHILRGIELGVKALEMRE